MLFDTDILIWIQRGDRKAATLIERATERRISLQTYLELLQLAKDKSQHRYTKDFLVAFGFIILPLTENIGHRAAIYLEEYALAAGLRGGDALIAATATENSLTMVTGNAKHFRVIKDLSLKVFTP